MNPLKSQEMFFDSEISAANMQKSFVSSVIETQESDKDKCVFCPKLKSFKETFSMLNKALYLKYSSSQNYYYTKDINDFVENEKKPHVIHFKFQVNYENEDETLTRYYNSSEFDYKLNYLTEYYKYHKEVPRLFMIPLCHIMNNFHDRKRRIEYFKIKKMLNEQNKGVVTTNNQQTNERETSEEKKSSNFSEESEKNSQSKLEKKNSKILDFLNFSSKELKEQSQLKNKKNSKEMESITLEELNFFLSKIEDVQIEDNELNEILKDSNNINNNNNYKNENNTDNNVIKEANFKRKEKKINEENNKNLNLPSLNLNFKTTDIIITENKSQKMDSNKNSLFSQSEQIKNNKSSLIPSKTDGPKNELETPEPNNLANALKKIDGNNKYNEFSNNNVTKKSVSQFFTFRDLSKNIQIFNKLIENQKTQMKIEKTNQNVQKNTKSHRVFNSIDFNYNPNFKTSAKMTPKNVDEKMKTISLSNFQNFLSYNKEKLNDFIQSKLNSQKNSLKQMLPNEKKMKNSSLNSIKKSDDQISSKAANNNHRRIMSSEGKNHWSSVKTLTKEKNFIKQNIFQTTSNAKKSHINFDFFNEKNINSPKPLWTTMSENSPNKYIKHFKPISPSVSIPISLRQETNLKKPQPVGFRKLNLDEKIYMKKNRVKPKSFQLHLKTSENENNSDMYNEYKVKEQGNSKNTSINSKASGNLTAKSKTYVNNFRKMAKGNSSDNLKKKKDHESSTQQMKINIISNFFNFNNGASANVQDKETNPIFMKLKNEFSNLKNIPNYKFLDISNNKKYFYLSFIY